jgi:MarR family 2-MHQ and catechol resistance regulon transcriptional repressor
MGTHYKGKPGEVRSLDAYIKLIRATGSVRAGLERKLALHKLTENQLSVLEVLLHLGPMCQTALATKIRATTASVTLLVDQLEDRKLVHRERSAEDRRFVNVTLTAEGKRFIEKIFPGHAQAIAESFGALTAAELEELGRLCRKLGLHAAKLSQGSDEEEPS